MISHLKDKSVLSGKTLDQIAKTSTNIYGKDEDQKDATVKNKKATVFRYQFKHQWYSNRLLKSIKSRMKNLVAINEFCLVLP